MSERERIPFCDYHNCLKHDDDNSGVHICDLCEGEKEAFEAAEKRGAERMLEVLREIFDNLNYKVPDKNVWEAYERLKDTTKC